jgi:hypothetical protein
LDIVDYKEPNETLRSFHHISIANELTEGRERTYVRVEETRNELRTNRREVRLWCVNAGSTFPPKSVEIHGVRVACLPHLRAWQCTRMVQ